VKVKYGNIGNIAPFIPTQAGTRVSSVCAGKEWGMAPS